MKNYLIDTHAHLDFPELSTRLDEVLSNALKNDVKRIVTISTNLNKIGKIIEISENHQEVFHTVGIHPNEVLKDKNNSNYEMILNLSKNKKCVGIGECGLDYHYGKDSKVEQKASFITQIEVARATSLPLIIHARDADKDMIEILENEYKNGPFKAILHCFSSGEELAYCGLDLDFFISFSGIITFNSAKNIQKIAKNIPLDQTVKWLTSIAPQGLIEFVPKNDITVQKMLTLKGDIFNDYNEENFKKLLKKNSEIISEIQVSDSGRKIFEFKRN